MAVENTRDGAGGANQNPAGGQSDPGGDDSGGQPTGQVSYETHRKLLSEKKKRDEELAALRDKLSGLEKKEKDREEADAKARDDYKKLVEIREADLNTANEKLARLEGAITDARKADAFIQTLGGNLLNRKFLELVPMNDIVIDPTTGEIDQMSVTKVVDKWKKEFPGTFTVRGHSGMPDAAPQGTGTGIDLAEWRKLPFLEQKKRYPEMLATERAKRQRA